MNPLHWIFSDVQLRHWKKAGTEMVNNSVSRISQTYHNFQPSPELKFGVSIVLGLLIKNVGNLFLNYQKDFKMRERYFNITNDLKKVKFYYLGEILRTLVPVTGSKKIEVIIGNKNQIKPVFEDTDQMVSKDKSFLLVLDQLALYTKDYYTVYYDLDRWIATFMVSETEIKLLYKAMEEYKKLFIPTWLGYLQSIFKPDILGDHSPSFIDISGRTLSTNIYNTPLLQFDASCNRLVHYQPKGGDYHDPSELIKHIAWVVHKYKLLAIKQNIDPEPVARLIGSFHDTTLVHLNSLQPKNWFDPEFRFFQDLVGLDNLQKGVGLKRRDWENNKMDLQNSRFFSLINWDVLDMSVDITDLILKYKHKYPELKWEAFALDPSVLTNIHGLDMKAKQAFKKERVKIKRVIKIVSRMPQEDKLNIVKGIKKLQLEREILDKTVRRIIDSPEEKETNNGYLKKELTVLLESCEAKLEALKYGIEIISASLLKDFSDLYDDAEDDSLLNNDSCLLNPHYIFNPTTDQIYGDGSQLLDPAIYLSKNIDVDLHVDL